MLRNNQAKLVENLQDKEVLLSLYLTQLILLVAGLVSGYFLFEDLPSFLKILKLDMKEILLFGGGSAIIVIIIDVIIMKTLPKHLYDDGGINEKVFNNRPIWHSFIICLIVAICEEFFFRGVLQTHFGYLTASIVFAVVHIRYLSKWFLFVAVVSLSFMIGWIFLLTGNLLVTIFLHFLIDFIAALMIRSRYLNNEVGTR